MAYDAYLFPFSSLTCIRLPTVSITLIDDKSGSLTDTMTHLLTDMMTHSLTDAVTYHLVIPIRLYYIKTAAQTREGSKLNLV